MPWETHSVWLVGPLGASIWLVVLSTGNAQAESELVETPHACGALPSQDGRP